MYRRNTLAKLETPKKLNQFLALTVKAHVMPARLGRPEKEV